MSWKRQLLSDTSKIEELSKGMGIPQIEMERYIRANKRSKTLEKKKIKWERRHLQKGKNQLKPMRDNKTSYSKATEHDGDFKIVLPDLTSQNIKENEIEEIDISQQEIQE